jgi:hypothetical protein
MAESLLLCYYLISKWIKISKAPLLILNCKNPKIFRFRLPESRVYIFKSTIYRTNLRIISLRYCIRITRVSVIKSVSNRVEDCRFGFSSTHTSGIWSCKQVRPCQTNTQSLRDTFPSEGLQTNNIQTNNFRLITYIDVHMKIWRFPTLSFLAQQGVCFSFNFNYWLSQYRDVETSVVVIGCNLGIYIVHAYHEY